MAAFEATVVSREEPSLDELCVARHDDVDHEKDDNPRDYKCG